MRGLLQMLQPAAGYQLVVIIVGEYFIVAPQLWNSLPLELRTSLFLSQPFFILHFANLLLVVPLLMFWLFLFHFQFPFLFLALMFPHPLPGRDRGAISNRHVSLCVYTLFVKMWYINTINLSELKQTSKFPYMAFLWILLFCLMVQG